MTDVLATWTGRSGSADGDGGRPDAQHGPVPGYGLFATADDGQVALGVVSEQHFWSSLCAELGLGDLADLELRGALRPGCRDAARRGRGHRPAAPRRAGRPRSTAAAVPVAPVLDRPGMLAGAPFPAFPIRLPLPEVTQKVPAVDQHRGEGFPAR